MLQFQHFLHKCLVSGRPSGSWWNRSGCGGPGGSSGSEVHPDVSDEPTGEKQRSLEPAAEICFKYTAGTLGHWYTKCLLIQCNMHKIVSVIFDLE